MIPVAAVDVLNVIFQVGDPGPLVESRDTLESVSSGKAEFRKYLIFSSGSKAELRLERKRAAAQIIITIYPLILVSTGQNSAD